MKQALIFNDSLSLLSTKQTSTSGVVGLLLVNEYVNGHFLSFLFVPWPETPVPCPKICLPIFLASSEEAKRMLQFPLAPEMHHIATSPG